MQLHLVFLTLSFAYVHAMLDRGGAGNLAELHLHNCSLKDIGTLFISDLIKAGCRFKTLDLGLNEIGDSGTTALAEALTADSNQVEYLQMRLNRCRNDGAKALAGALPDAMCKLKFLGLASNIIGSDGLRALMEVMELFCMLSFVSFCMLYQP